MLTGLGKIEAGSIGAARAKNARIRKSWDQKKLSGPEARAQPTVQPRCPSQIEADGKQPGPGAAPFRVTGFSSLFEGPSLE